MLWEKLAMMQLWRILPVPNVHLRKPAPVEVTVHMPLGLGLDVSKCTLRLLCHPSSLCSDHECVRLIVDNLKVSGAERHLA